MGEAGAQPAPSDAAIPEMIEVWRPGGRSDDRRPRPDRNRHRHQGHPDRAREYAPAAAAGEVGEGERRERHGRGRRRRAGFPQTRPDATVGAAPPDAEAKPANAPRGGQDHAPRPRYEGKGRERDRDNKFGGRDTGGRDKGSRGGRDKRSDGGPSHRQYATSAAPRERDRPVDPNSPFAKLAALKEQLAANRKDQH